MKTKTATTSCVMSCRALGFGVELGLRLVPEVCFETDRSGAWSWQLYVHEGQKYEALDRAKADRMDLEDSMAQVRGARACPHLGFIKGMRRANLPGRCLVCHPGLSYAPR